MTDGSQHEGMQCEILSLECDFRRNEAWLYLADGDCCDMQGCIAFVTVICPHIERIYTMSGNRPDAAYFKTSDHAWKAMAYVSNDVGRGYVVVE